MQRLDDMKKAIDCYREYKQKGSDTPKDHKESCFPMKNQLHVEEL